jgi:ribosome-binding factor A
MVAKKTIKIQNSLMSRSHQKEHVIPSQRALRVGELVRHALADMLMRGDVHDPIIEGHLVTVPEVRMSPDLRLATIYLISRGEHDANDVVAAFERHKKFLRAEIAHRINLKFAPDLRFRVDDRFAEAERIDKLLHSPSVARDLETLKKKNSPEE